MSAADTQADVAIVGSGIAGAMVAYELARRGVKVVMLEAGPRVTREQIVTQHTITHKLDLSAPFPNTALAPRPDWSDVKNDYLVNDGPDRFSAEYLRIVGGTTWHWAAATHRLQPSDFEMKKRFGVAVDWPLTYADLEPYYVQAEREIGVSGDNKVNLGTPRSAPYPLPPVPPSYLDSTISKRLRGHGFRFVTRPSGRNSVAFAGRPACHGFGNCMPICPSGALYAAIVHVSKAEALGVVLLEEALVTRLVADNNGRIRSVIYKRPDGTERPLSAKAYVLAANGIETPRLMLASRSEHTPDGIANRSGQVGRYLMDHPGLSMRMTVPQPVYPGRGPQSNLACFDFNDGSFRSSRAAWVMSLDNRLHLHDITNELLQQKISPPELDRRIRYLASREVSVAAQFELLPDFENRISLDEKRVDSAGIPAVRINYRIDSYTRRAVVHTRRVLRQIGGLLRAERIKDTGLYGANHIIGTTRMGSDAKDSVVDSDCRTHDHPNLYIAGSSVFPTAGTASPSLTIAALALRLAGTLRARL